MVRRKHQQYRPSPRDQKSRYHRDLPAAESQPRTLGNVFCSSTVAGAAPTHPSAALSRKKLARLKKTIVKVTVWNAVFSWASSVLGYVVISLERDSSQSEEAETATKCVLLLLSCIQVPLVAAYWEATLKYYEVVRKALTASTEQLTMSQKSLFSCLCECAFHVICPIPNVSWEGQYTLFGKTAWISLDSILYCAILIRNYHSFQLVFWLSRFANFRTQLFTNFANTRSYEGFLLRCYIATYTLRVVLVVIGVMILLPGVLKFVVESKQVLTDSATMQLDDFWIVAYSQLTIGYGDSVPRLFLVQVTIVLSCLLGVLILGLFNAISSRTLILNMSECNLYSDLLYAKHKQRYSGLATILLQRWWRLMLMRKRHFIHAKTILSFYSHLLVYRSTLVDCQHVKDTRFERQIEAFDRAIHRAIHPLNVYLGPVADAHTVVSPT